ncbi:hypothetical protein SODALDRAFT_134489 [Sodiomyces alkalinus F11]|uniref:Uncharacterized protein n=1 Tax=Sodiomyces alkalinus (strain CBS 110278 / VKM F-3762 / F11) TaxID=1314773 RepID=A0A3N2PYL5_SODAK|nr:hypothetical protein SODALDRAFT_134489 [Sodiomyces alkalinus F11]ROT39629.1 hypothetical protein SODALDRAFT_134489 [Sodiomyces alkalinus F11]
MSTSSFQFVHISKPADAANHRKQIRSHAARNSKARRERVVQYQVQLRQEDSRRKPGPPSPLTSESESSSGSSSSSSSSSELYSTVQTPATPATSATADGAADPPWPLIPIYPARRGSPSPISLLDPASQDPFHSFSQPLSPFEGFLLNHFAKHVTLNELSAFPCPDSTGVSPVVFGRNTGVSWTQTAASDYGMRAMIFLISCRSLSSLQHSDVYDSQALRYKAVCLRQLNSIIAQERDTVGDMTIIKALALASEEFFAGNKKIADKHLQAVVKMVRIRGQPVNVGMWKHSENQHLWSHWKQVLAGWSSNSICLLRVVFGDAIAGMDYANPPHLDGPINPSYDMRGSTFRRMTAHDGGLRSII